MAQRVQVLLVCDLHEDEVEGEETVEFALDGTSYEIDLCAEHAEELRDSMAPFVGAGRRSGGARSGGGRRGRARSAAGGSGKQRGSDIRQWAPGHGLAVGERGRIAGSIIEQYEAAH